MNKLEISVATAALVICLNSIHAQPAHADIVSPAKRAPTVELALKLAKAPGPEASRVPTDLVNPFNPPGFDGPDAAELAAIAAAKSAKANQPRTGPQLLADLASQLAPTGSAVLGGESYLLFGQKKMKLGDKVTITFEGGVYEVEIAAIERTSFTIRLNRDEYSRPIKPGKNP